MLISLIVGIVVLGLLYWIVSLISLPDPFPQIIKVLFILIAVLYILDATGLYHTGVSFPIR